MAFAESAGGGEPASSPESGPASGMRSWVPLLAVCAGYFMVILDVTVINVAVPVIGRELSASLTGIQWITDGYTLVFAGFLLSGGALGDRLGNRRIFRTGVAVFTVSSAACAFAPTAPVLIAARVVEGLGAALLVPGSLALLQQAYPAPAARSRAFGVWGSIAGIAASAGPLLGGLLVATVGWRWVFLINLPVGVACLVLTLRHVAPSDRLTGRALDWPAQCAVVAAVASLTAALNEAGRRGWSDPAVLAGVGLSVLAAMAFLMRERLARSPAVPPSLLRSRALGGAAVIGLLFNFGFYGMVFTASLDFQHQRGYSALVTGLALFPAVAMTMFASVLSGRLARTTGDRPLVFTGMLLAGLGLAGWVTAGVEPPYSLLVAPMMAAGFGTSFALTGSASTVMGAAPAAYSGTASALFNTTRQLGSAMGVALGGTLLATAADYGEGLRISMAIGALAYLAAAGLAWFCVPPKPKGERPDTEARTSR
ncbi:MFS transporter [Streptomyces melanosporofaciens]|uniref:MFS transporter, DHA2 family, methylenomycin A resistance protein n=1 Tax=Streptomyces melanosporofaciens TaxID=67327 RepID=A0A1H5C2G0_STRMJ|nr:MFS transporter [Streptomyces melanosporofaciens]SED61039.1 MFS transporter, DHA2 family, methylenomycin A resistance protein [Streptomyces melanosporofaciens]